ncbi:MAG: sugar phosphate nucleotidyltransferase [Acidobacteriota bacterium]|jgi:glucose-1-phosphate adenylyltransferase
MSDWKDRIADVTVAILGGGRGQRLDPLTRLRSKPAVPIAGKFRLIDIPISNSIHSDMLRMFVLTQFNSVSLHRHIVRTYAFHRFSRGFVQILAAQQTPDSLGWYQGTADAVRQNLPILTELRGDLVLILSGDHMYRMDYRRMLRDHLEHDADITLAVLPCSAEGIADFGAVRVDGTGRVVEFREKPKDAAARAGMEVDPALLAERGVPSERPYLASMGIYLFRKRVLRESLDNELHDFGHNVIPGCLESRKVQAHFFNGYWRDIGTIRAFYDAHLDLVRPDPPFDFHDPGWAFFTHPRFLPPARLDNVRFSRSLLAEGSRVRDSEIEDSIVGIRSEIRGATIRRSLVMGLDEPEEDAAGRPGIGPGTVIQDAIVDKNARIGRDVRLVNGSGRQDGEGPGWVLREGIIVVPKNAVVPDGTAI